MCLPGHLKCCQLTLLSIACKIYFLPPGKALLLSYILRLHRDDMILECSLSIYIFAFGGRNLSIQ